jgi:endonuclease-3
MPSKPKSRAASSPTRAVPRGKAGTRAKVIARSSSQRPPDVAPVDNRALPAIFRHLRREAAKKEAPVVTLIAVTTREPWRVLSSCILSLRTQDGTTAKAAARMFERWPDLRSMAAADPKVVEKAIYPVGFYRTKAPQLVEMARRILDEWKGRVPDEIDELLKLKGVGRKTANLVVVAGYSKPGICVDTHVHRITNRLGFVVTRAPDETELALRKRLPRRHWIGLNDLLVAFGQNLCQPLSPHCSHCPVRRACWRVGVTRSR